MGLWFNYYMDFLLSVQLYISRVSVAHDIELKSTRWSSFMALNRPLDMLSADWQFQILELS